MDDRHVLIAYLGTLLTIIILAGAGAYAVTKNNDATVYLAAITGLIGVVGTFRPRSPTSNIEQADTVNQGTEK